MQDIFSYHRDSPELEQPFNGLRAAAKHLNGTMGYEERMRLREVFKSLAKPIPPASSDEQQAAPQ